MTLHFQDEVATNLLTIDATDPKSGTAEFKATAIRVEKLRARPPMTHRTRAAAKRGLTPPRTARSLPRLGRRASRPEGGTMGFYMCRASYTLKGIEGVLKEGGTARAAAVKALVESVGGKVVCQYWAFGADDFFLIAELPDNTTAAGLAATVGASGAASVTTTVLLTADEVDAAVRLHPAYRAPGA